jgi:hypothetical protein
MKRMKDADRGKGEERGGFNRESGNIEKTYKTRKS